MGGIGGIAGIAKYNAMDPQSPLHFHKAFSAFMDRRTKAAEYVLEPCCPVPGDARRIAKTVTYPGMFLTPKVLYVIRRNSQRSPSPG